MAPVYETRSRSAPSKQSSILIVGAGVFGLSTARELATRGYSNVTVLDRYPPPVPDGSSVDISRVIRPDYADHFYARLGLQAMEGWENEFSPYFYQSGLLCATQNLENSYIEESKKNLERLGRQVRSYEGKEANICYPAIHGDLSCTRGYSNSSCGWADAEGSIRYQAGKCIEAGVSFVTGPQGTVVSLIHDKRKVTGVMTRAGISRYADYIIIATGAWTSRLLDMNQVSVSNTQPVGFMQLTEEEAREMAGCPVMIDLSTGWFAFPPTPGTNILKMARHGYGFEIIRGTEDDKSSISAPLIDKNNASSQFLPEEAEKALRDGLALFLPKFRDRPFIRKRLCWYTDTPKGNFIVDYHADYTNVFLATGGSGHAFKFLPVIGSRIVDAFEMRASAEQNTKWAWSPSNKPIAKGDGSRGGPPRRSLTLEERARL